MSFSHWQRLNNMLIELSLTSAGAEPDEQGWLLRLAGGELELKTVGKDGKPSHTIKILRCGVGIELIECTDPCTPIVDNSTPR